MTTIKPEIISFKTCPFVQRVIITLLEKNITFTTTYIDLANKPDWFLDISPMGKVPVLRIGEHVLFESAVINEYLDEVYPPKMHPNDPIQRAINRAWIEFSSGLTMNIVQIGRAETEEVFLQAKQECLNKLVQLEKHLVNKPYFNGEMFSLVDTAYAPCFMRLYYAESFYPLQLLDRFPKVKAWSNNLLARKSVQKSVVSEYPQLLLQSIKSKNSFFSKQIAA